MLDEISLGSLWLGLLKFYSVEFEVDRLCVSIVHNGKLGKEQHTKRLYIEGILGIICILEYL